VIGIYGIIVNGKWYIGSSTDITARVYSHISELENSRCCRKDMQEQYDKTNDYDWKILKISKNESTLVNWENYYMGLYHSIESGYNSIVASRKIGSGRKNKKPLKEPLESEYSEEAS
jgi:hypothetical protein